MADAVGAERTTSSAGQARDLARPAGTVTHEDTHLVLFDEPKRFGRASGNDLRIGHAPLVDEIVPRRCGSVWGDRGRVVVSNDDDRLAFDVVVAGFAPTHLSPGWWLAPAASEFEIVVSGARGYSISVDVNVEAAGIRIVEADDDDFVDDVPTGARLNLTDRQRAVLDAYVAPVLDGGSPATHQQVADRLPYSRALVRQECNKIWSKMLLAGIPMRDLTDARDQIVDAWTRHRL